MAGVEEMTTDADVDRLADPKMLDRILSDELDENGNEKPKNKEPESKDETTEQEQEEELTDEEKPTRIRVQQMTPLILPFEDRDNDLFARTELERAAQVTQENNQPRDLSQELLMIGIQMAVFHVEASSRKFADFAAKMV